LDQENIILDAAEKIFRKYGLQRANVMDIANEAGISKKTIYNHYKGKADLFHKAMERLVKREEQSYRELLLINNVSIKEKITGFIITSVRICNYRYIKDLKKSNPSLGRSVFDYLLSISMSLFSGFIDNMKEEGYCSDEYSSDEITMTVFTAINGMISWEDRDSLPVRMDDLYKIIATIFFSAFLTQKGKKAVSPDDITYSKITETIK